LEEEGGSLLGGKGKGDQMRERGSEKKYKDWFFKSDRKKKREYRFLSPSVIKKGEKFKETQCHQRLVLSHQAGGRDGSAPHKGPSQRSRPPGRNSWRGVPSMGDGRTGNPGTETLQEYAAPSSLMEMLGETVQPRST